MTTTAQRTTPYGDVDGAWPGPRAAFRPRAWQVALAAAVYLWLLLDVLLDGPMRAIDGKFAPWLLDIGIREHPSWRHVGFALSQAGGRGFNLIWIVILCAVIFAQRRTLAPLAKALSATAILWAVIYPFKDWLSRSFPADPRGDYLYAVSTPGGAFPSGHQANAMLLGGVGAWIAMEYIRTAWVRTLVCAYALAAPFISAVAVLVMGYHWLTDVIAGTCAGVVLLALVRWAWSTAPGQRLTERLTFDRR